MHGRLRVRTTAEEQAKKKKEQEQKVKLYRAAMNRILAKRNSNEFDLEMMELTAKVLGSNPDISTLWNIRKECIMKFFEENTENLLIFDKDLGFTEVCLQVNPKSYGAWHHRCWILEKSPSPNWNREVELCTKYLRFDERNFHCWDYRRYVVEKAGVTAESELQFCTEKIEKNFSNYSSWHNRSKLLPVLYPHEEDKTRPICEEKLQEELDLVLTAAFTDPNDSSAWFYQRWLLGYSAPELDIASFKISSDMAVISFTIPINLNSNSFTITTNFCPELEFKIFRSSKEDEPLDTTWILKDSFTFDQAEKEFKVILKDDKNLERTLILKRHNGAFFGIKLPRFEYEFGRAICDQLEEQLKSCNQLLEFEPDSKWTILTAALLLRAIDRKKNLSKALEYLEKLQKVDEMRKGYYKDLASKWSIQERLEIWINNGKFDENVNLSGLNLTALFYEEYLSGAEKIDLSNNNLSSRNLGKLKDLQCCKKLTLKNNVDINSLATFPSLDSLEELVINSELNINEDELFQKCKCFKKVTREN